MGPREAVRWKSSWLGILVVVFLGWTRVTRLEWNAGAVPENFRVWDEKGTRMVWRVEGQRIVCEEGMEFLLPGTKERDE